MRPIFLIGYMGAGKSTLGGVLGPRLHRSFVDLDKVIEERAGKSVMQIFKEDGETAFRGLEAMALRSLVAQSVVVATGGGTASEGDNLSWMRAHGEVVYLWAKAETLWHRVASSDDRPLVKEGKAAFVKRFHCRESAYRGAHLSVNTEEAGHSACADLLTTVLDTAASRPLWSNYAEHSSIVGLGSQSYPVVVATGLRHQLGQLIKQSFDDTSRPTKIAIISDTKVAGIYGGDCLRQLRNEGFDCQLVQVPEGETSKSVPIWLSLVEQLLAAGLDRSSLVVALGGGVVGDLAGFAAASLMRGIRLVQIPTTLLAMTDSAIGGKTGINATKGKNLIGAFWQPQSVFVDPEFLTTLNQRQRRAAYGELLKYGLLSDQGLFDEICELAPYACALELEGTAEQQARLCHVIAKCVAYKSWVVTLDEREQSGLRAWLNLGHTIGHAIEAEAGYGTLLHGEAVALGLLASLRVSAILGLCEPDLESQLAQVLENAGLSADIDSWLRPEVVARVSADKKRDGKKVKFIAVHGVGRPEIVPLELEELTRILRP